MIMNIIILQGLQMQEPLNYFSTAFSVCSVVFGFGDYLSYIVNLDEGGAPFSITLWGAAASTIDNLFRATFMAYLYLLFKGWSLFIIPAYVSLMFIAICFKKKEVSIKSDDILGTFASLPCSAYENRNVKYTFRLISKIVFAFIFLPTIIYITYDAV